MKVFINPGHAPWGDPDPGACGFGLRESDVAYNVGAFLEEKLNAAGIETKNLQSDDLGSIPGVANYWGADLFVSIHCNAFNGVAKGTETCVYSLGGESAHLGQEIQTRIVSRMGTVDRGLKERPGLCVLRATDMPAVLVELAFIDEEDDNAILRDKQHELAGCIADGIFAYAGIAAPTKDKMTAPNGKPYEQNDIDYLVNLGYDLDGAIALLSTVDKYKN